MKECAGGTRPDKGPGARGLREALISLFGGGKDSRLSGIPWR